MEEIDKDNETESFDNYWERVIKLAKDNKPQYLHSWDLSLKCPAVTIFDMETFKPVYIQHYLMKGKQTHGRRLYSLYMTAMNLILEYPPTTVSIERGFSRFNTETQVIYRVVGVFNMAYHETPQFYYPPKTVKAALLHGEATKAQLQAIIRERYPDIKFSDGKPGEDESDSFAIGVTHMIEHRNMPWDKPEKKKKNTTRKKKKEEK